MTLATRCPKCNTTFRIVPDQLKISEGLVRCGQCQYIFNAAQHQISPLPLTTEHVVLSSPKSKDTSASKVALDKQTTSSSFEDSKFADSLFPEFHIGWGDTVMDQRSLEKSSFSKAIAQSKETLSQADIPDEVIELDDTDFTESLMRFGDSAFDLSEELVVDDDDDDSDAFLNSGLFEDSLVENLSLGSQDTTLPPDVFSTASHQELTLEEESRDQNEKKNKPTLSKQERYTITSSDLSLLPNSVDEEEAPSNLGLSKPIVIPLPTESLPPLKSKVKNEGSSFEDSKFQQVKQKPKVRKDKSRQGKGESIAELSEKFANSFSLSDSSFSEDFEQDSLLSRQTTRIKDDDTTSDVSGYGNASSFSTTRLNEKYKKISTSLHEQQIADLSFVKQSRNYWETPVAKGIMLILSIALFAALIAQSIQYRHFIVSYAPIIRPALVMLAEPLGLSVDYPISLDLHNNVTLDSANLETLPDGSHQFDVMIRNRASYPIAVPYVELTLTNVSGEVIARKIFSPTELGVDQATIAPQKELFIRRNLDVSIQGVNGVNYSTDLLYL